MFVLQGGEHMNKLLKDLYDCFYTPPELAADIFDRGIVMTGGGSLVYGFDKLVTARTGIHTTVADDAISCVVLGTGKSLDSLNSMQDGTMNLSRRKQMT